MRKVVLLVVALIALGAPAVAHAVETDINFSELGLPEFTTIQDQYAGSPYLVRFGNAEKFGFPAPPPLLTCGNPYLQNGELNGTALGIACLSGSDEFPERRFGVSMEFQNEQRMISFNIVNRTTHPQTAVTKFYGVGSSTPLTTLTTVLSPNAITPISYDHLSQTNGIIGVVIQSAEEMDYSDSGGVFIDDLVQTHDATPPPAKYTLALQQPSAEVVEGSTVDVPVSVRRYNGSSGPVTLSVGSLPPGIESTQWIPSAAVTGSDPATLRIKADSPFTGTRQLSVSASGGGSAGTGVGTTELTQTVNGIAALYFATGGRSPIRLVPGCGPQKIKDSFGVRGGFSGYTDYNFAESLDTSGLDRLHTTTGDSLYVSGDGTYPIEYNLDPGSGDGAGALTIEVNPYEATPVDLNVNWLSDRLAIDSVLNPSPALPVIDGGSTVSVVGNFPLNCPVTFQDQAGQTWPLKETNTTTNTEGRQRDLYILNVPATGVSGPLKAMNASGTVMATTQPIDVREFRRSDGLSQENGGSGAKGTYSWGDFERTFGTDDTDACFIVCVHDPVASDYYEKFQADVESGEGLCYGYAVMAARFRGYGTEQKPSDYQPGAARAWDIAPVTDGTAVKRDVVRWFVAQFDKSAKQMEEEGASRSPADERRLVKELINQQGAALVTFRQEGKGHAVTAYSYQDLPNGGIKLAIYDPNVPFTTAENTNNKTRSNALSTSSITIEPDGSWSGSSEGWKGGNSSLMVVANIPPLDANLPSTFSLASLFSSAGGASPAKIEQIESGGRPQLDSDGLAIEKSSVDVVPSYSGGQAPPEYQLQKGREYELTIKGTGKGSYDSSALSGGDDASVRGADTAKGQLDHVTIRPGQASLQFETGAASASVSYDLKTTAGKAVKTASIAMAAHEGGEDEAELTGGTVRLTHDGGATKASVTLSSVGAGLPTSVQTVPLSLGRGQRLELKPRSWSELNTGVRYAVKAKSGRVLRSGTARLRATRVVSLSGLHASAKSGTVTVQGRIGKRGSDPVLVASVTVPGHSGRFTASLSGAKVKAGRFTLNVHVPHLRAGTRVRVVAILLDQSANLASVQRNATIRASRG
jgi:hypothetical protein